MNKTPTPQILAPAGNDAMLKAAVYAGANAVYLGLQGFNARRTADNFTIDALGQTVAFCHARNVQVYVALNTLIYPAEISAVANSIQTVAQAGADALIVQDLAVAALAKQMAPSLPLHASTQMSVHSLAGAKQLAEMGFSRVILSRELSLPEIEHITRNCGIETEVFVHGALCMSVSGQCYLSAFLGGRSGNRGACAGPCRLPFSAGEAGAHHLSLKDLSVIDKLPALAAAGVSSVKIEGRLRTPEYAAAAVNACVHALAGTEYDAQLLQDVFSRSGFTNSYLMGKIDGNMFGIRTGEDSAAAKAALPQLRELFRRERQSVPVTLTLTLTADGTKLTAADKDGNKAIVYGETLPVPAQKDPSDAYRRALAKTGGTPFAATEIVLAGEENLFVPAGELGEMRRKVLENLLQKRSEPRPIACAAPQMLSVQTHAKPPQKIMAQFMEIEQMPENAADCNGLIFPLSLWRQVPQTLRAKTWLALPRGVFGKAEDVAAQQIADSKNDGFAGYFVQNMAHIGLCKHLPMMGGFGLNIANPLAAQEYAALGLSAATLSPEMTTTDMAQIAPETMQTAILAYGHMPLMLTRACPLQNIRTCADCNGRGSLLDRKAMRMPVRCTAPGMAGVRTVYNPIPLYMGDKLAELPVDIALLDFTIETKEEAQKIMAAFKAHRASGDDFTRGLYFKGTN
ncbi:MAG: U32 family peptidase [Ruthenibacterium sp.]